MLSATCHCGAVVLEVASKPRKLTQCNCSICRRYGVLWAYYSRKTARVVSGQRSLSVYRFRNGGIEFNHCKVCGVVTHYEWARKTPDSKFVVNARNLDPDVVASTRIKMLDGAATWKVLEEYVQPDIFRSPAKPPPPPARGAVRARRRDVRRRRVASGRHETRAGRNG